MASLTHLGEVRGRYGHLVVRGCKDPAVFWVEAHGFVTPHLLRSDLALAARFAEASPPGWTYVADIGAVRAVHPLNPFLLRGVRRLPGLGQYLVVAPSRMLRALVWMGRPLVRPDAVLREPEAVWERLGEGAAPPITNGATACSPASSRSSCSSPPQPRTPRPSNPSS